MKTTRTSSDSEPPSMGLIMAKVTNVYGDASTHGVRDYFRLPSIYAFSNTAGVHIRKVFIVVHNLVGGV